MWWGPPNGFSKTAQTLNAILSRSRDTTQRPRFENRRYECTQLIRRVGTGTVRSVLQLRNKDSKSIRAINKWFTEHGYLFWPLRYAHLIFFALDKNGFQSVKSSTKTKRFNAYDAYQKYLYTSKLPYKELVSTFIIIKNLFPRNKP